MSSNDFQINGLVIRVIPSGDNDRLVTILTAERGKLTFMAKGARSLKSRYMPACNPYVYGNYEIHAKGDGLWLREAEISEAFAGIGHDIAAMYLAQYISEVCSELCEPEYPSAELLRLSLNCFYAISVGLKPLQQIKAVFELRAAALSGYEPDLSACIKCGNDKSAVFYLDVMNGGIVCADCASMTPQLPQDAPAGAVPTDEYMTRVILLPLTPVSLAAARYVLGAEEKKILSFELAPGRDTNSLSKAAECYLLSHLERGFPTLKTYYEVLK